VTSIGVWNTAFLGDAVLTLPLLQSLRAAYPEAAVHYWVRKGFGALFAAHPAVTEVFEYDKRGADHGFFQAVRLGRELARQRHSVWICAHSSLRSALLSRWSGAKIRIGYTRPRLGAWCFTHTVSRRFHELEEIERLLRLLIPLQLPEVQPWPQLVLPRAAETAARDILAPLREQSGSAPILGLHPGSVWATKRWPAACFAEIGARALAAGAGLVLFAGPGEGAVSRAVLEGILATAGPAAVERLLDLSGKLSLPVLAACLGRLDCYLTNDSGPMHLAWPQQTPVVALFGPTVRELGFFPRGDAASVVEIDLPCRPCGLHGPQECPRGHHDCMKKITPDLVWPQVSKRLARR
jgi:heptosyltransferase-2